MRMHVCVCVSVCVCVCVCVWERDNKMWIVYVCWSVCNDYINLSVYIDTKLTDLQRRHGNCPGRKGVSKCVDGSEGGSGDVTQIVSLRAEALSTESRRMEAAWKYRAQQALFATTSSWVGWIVEISSVGNYRCRSKSRKFYNIYIFLSFWCGSHKCLHSLGSPLVNLAPSRISSPFNLSLPRILLGSIVVVTVKVVEGLSSTHFPFGTIPSGWITTVTDQDTHVVLVRLHHDIHHRRVLSTWFCCECEVWLCHTGDSSSDCFMQWHTRLHV